MQKDCHPSATDSKTYSINGSKPGGKTDSTTVTNTYAPTSSAEDEKWNTFMIFKEQWLTVTQNKTSLCTY